MVNRSDDLFEYVDNFKETGDVSSIPIFESELKKCPKVTIAIPTYKRTNLLKEAVDSALSQINFEDYDVIVVDNNPERGDEVEKLMLSYNNTRLSYYKNEKNIGMVGNWNRLYTIARGEWVVMLHDDDLLYNDYLYCLLGEPNSKISGVDAFFPSFVSNDKDRIVDNKVRTLNLKICDFLRSNVIGAPVGMCVRKKCVIELGGFSANFHPSHDYAFYAKLVYNHYKAIKYSGHTLCYYRISENESLKSDTIVGFLECDDVIKRNILKNKSHVIRLLWLNYIKSYKVYFIEKEICVDFVKDQALNRTFKYLKKQETIYSKCVFNIIRLYKMIEMRLRNYM